MKRESFGTKLKRGGDMRGGNYVKGGDYKSIEIEITKVILNGRLGYCT